MKRNRTYAGRRVDPIELDDDEQEHEAGEDSDGSAGGVPDNDDAYDDVFCPFDSVPQIAFVSKVCFCPSPMVSYYQV